MALDKNYDAIVVGGGHNGLVAASYLARAGKRVVLLEAEAELGGATTSVRPFPEFDARLSRYSYLVSLLPDQIVADLGINFKTLERSIASYTPYSNKRGGSDGGLLISQNWDERTAQSFQELTGSETKDKHIYLAGAGSRRGGGVSGIAGHNAAMAVLAND
jgi:phytoene dehydrogenase-like protein